MDEERLKRIRANIAKHEERKKTQNIMGDIDSSKLDRSNTSYNKNDAAFEMAKQHYQNSYVPKKAQEYYKGVENYRNAYSQVNKPSADNYTVMTPENLVANNLADGGYIDENTRNYVQKRTDEAFNNQYKKYAEQYSRLNSRGKEKYNAAQNAQKTANEINSNVDKFYSQFKDGSEYTNRIKNKVTEKENARLLSYDIPAARQKLEQLKANEPDKYGMSYDSRGNSDNIRGEYKEWENSVKSLEDEIQKAETVQQFAKDMQDPVKKAEYERLQKEANDFQIQYSNQDGVTKAVSQVGNVGLNLLYGLGDASYGIAESIKNGIGAGVSLLDPYNITGLNPYYDGSLGNTIDNGIQGFFDYVHESKATRDRFSSYYNQGLRTDLLNLTGNEDVSNFFADTISNTANALAEVLPNLALAYATGGTSLTATSVNALNGLSKTQKAAMFAKSTLKGLAKNPSFWYSFIREGGSAYNEAKAQGASELEANIAMFGTGLPNALIEIGGGVESLPNDKSANGIRQWIKSFVKTGAEEGFEEIEQGIVSQLMAKAVYAPEMSWFTVGEDGIIDPVRMIQEFYGGFVGGSFGGSVGKAINVASYTVANNMYKSDSMRELIQSGKYTEMLKALPDSDFKNSEISKTFSAEMDEKQTLAKLKGISNRQLIKQYDSMVDALSSVSEGNVASLALIATGDTKTATEVAPILRKLYDGKVITEEEAKIISRNENVVNMLSETTGLDMTNSSWEDFVTLSEQAQFENITGTSTGNAIADVVLGNAQRAEAGRNYIAEEQNKYANDLSGTPTFTAQIGDESVRITGIDHVENGEVYVNLSNGTTQEAQSLNTDEVTTALLSYASEYDAKTASAFIGGYTGNISVGEYARSFAGVNSAARTGLSYENIAKTAQTMVNNIGESTAKYLAETGNVVAQEQKAKYDDELKNLQSRQAKRLDKASVKNETNGTATKEHKRLARTISKITGYTVTLVDSTNGYNNKQNGRTAIGSINSTKGEIVLDIGEGNVAATSLHESVHYIRINAPEEFNAMAKYVVEWLTRNGTLEEYLDRYESSYKLDNIYDLTEEMTADVAEALLKNADFVEDLFTDEAFIKEICGENRTFAEKFVDALKSIIEAIKNYLKSGDVNHLIAGKLSEDAKALEEIKNLWEDGLKAAVDNHAKMTGVKENTDTESSGGKMSISEETDYDTPITLKDIEILRSIGRKSINQFTSEDIEKSAKWAYKFYKELGTKSPFFRAWFGDWRAYDLSPVIVANIPEYIGTNEARKEKRGNVTNKDTATNEEKTNGWIIRISRDGETNTISHSGKNRLSEYGLAGIRELIENAVWLDSEVHEHHSNNAKDDRITFDHKLYALGKDTSGNIALYKITIEEQYANYKNAHDKRFHNLKYIKKVADNIGSLTRDLSHDAESTNDASTTTYSISDLFNFVNTYDKEFKPKPVNETMIENGLPKKFYHQTSKDFTVFNTNSERAGKNDSETPTGMFFKTNDNDIGVEGSKQMAVYLNARNILEFKNRDEARSYWTKNVEGYSELQKQYDEIDKRYEKIYEEEEAKGDKWYEEHYDDLVSGKISDEEALRIMDEPLSKILEEWKSETDPIRRKQKALITNYVRKSDYDCVHLVEDGKANGNMVETYIVFEPTQIKSATDNIGTFDGSNPDIRYSLSETDSNGNKLSETEESKEYSKFVEKFFGTTYNWDETGYILNNGKQLDFSGKNDGGISGSRNLDHREIVDAFSDLDYYIDEGRIEKTDLPNSKLIDQLNELNGAEPLIDFLRRGNIRIMPETGGINLSVEPSKAQYYSLSDYISKNRGEVILDIDDESGNTIASVEYPRGTHSNKVINDIKNYFENGDIPYLSTVSEFHTKFSLSDRTSAEYDLLTQENEELKAQVEALKNEMELTSGHTVDAEAVSKLAQRYIREYKSKANVEEVSAKLKQIFDYVATEDANAEEANKAMFELASQIVNKSETLNTEMRDTFKDVLDIIRSAKIYVDDATKSEIESLYGDYNTFRKSMFGRMKLTTNKESHGQTVDMLVQELAALAPGQFDTNVSEGECLEQLVSFIEATKPRIENPFGDSVAEAASELAWQIFDDYFDTPEVKTFADKYEAKLQKVINENRIARAELRKAERAKAKAFYDEKLKALRDEKNEAIAKLRKEKNDKYDNDIKDLRDAKDKKLKEVRADRDEKLKALREHYREQQENKREKAAESELKARITVEYKKLYRDLMTNSKEHHIPEIYKESVANVLASIDLISKISKNKEARKGEMSKAAKQINDQLTKLNEFILQHSMYASKENGINTEELYNFDPDLSSNIEVLKKCFEYYANHIQNGTNAVRDMSRKEMETLYKVLKALRYAVKTADKAFSANIKQRITELAENSIAEMATDKTRNPFNKNKGMEAVGALDTYINSQMLDARSYHRGLGDSAMEIYKAFRTGLNTYISHIHEIQDYFAKVREESGLSEKQFKKLSEKYETYETSHGKITMSKAQLMSLYCLSKREQALEHIFGGGNRPTDLKGKRQVRPIHISPDELTSLLKNLNSTELAMAEKLQKFMATACAKWGNEVSMAMYGYAKFGDPHYFPIKSSQTGIKTNDQNSGGEAGLYSILNYGCTKSLVPNANNAIDIDDIFNVVSQHAQEMSSYSAYAGAVADGMRWLNYNNRKTGETIKQSMLQKFGTNCEKYFTELIRDINRNKPTGNYGGELSSLLVSAQKAAAIAGNLSVVIQQPTAIMRACAVLDIDLIAKGIAIAAPHPVKSAKEAQAHSEIAWWKSQGFFETNMGKSMDEIITGRSTAKDKVVGLAMWGAGFADDLTWGAIWEATKQWTKKFHPEVEVGSDEFFSITKEKFDDVVDQTQVVDSVLHRPMILRSKNALVKMDMSFMAEPLKSANLLRNAIVDVKNKKPNATKRLIRVYASCVMANVLAAAAKAIVMAFRDTGDDEWREKWLESFVGDLLSSLNPVSIIPFVKDILTLLDGYDVERMDMSAISGIIKFGQQMVTSAQKGELDTSLSLQNVYKLTRYLSQLTGIPVYNVLREVDTIIDIFGEPIFRASQATPDTERYEALYNAVMKNDEAEMQNEYDRLGKTQKEIEQRLKSKIIDDSKGNKMFNEDVDKAAKARINGDVKTAVEIVRNLADTTALSKDFWTACVNARVNKISKAQGNRTLLIEAGISKLTVDNMSDTEVNEALKSYETEADTSTASDLNEDTNTESLYTADDLVKALQDGNESDYNTAYDDMLSAKAVSLIMQAEADNKELTADEAEEKAENSIKSAITKVLKPLMRELYKTDKKKFNEMRKKIIKKFGYTSKQITKWLTSEE